MRSLLMLFLVTSPTVEPLTPAEVKAHLRLDSSNTEPAPSTAPTVALAGAGAGNVENGVHRLAISFGTADGETEPGPLSAPVTVADKSANGKLAASAIELGGSAVTYRKFWMPAVGTLAPLLYAGILNDNTSTTATINVADASLGAQAPTANTTADPQLVRLISTAREVCETVTHRALLTQTWDVKFDGWAWDGYFEVPRPPLQSVTSVSYIDSDGTTQAWASSNYRVSAPVGPKAARGRIELAYDVTSWPTVRGISDSVTVRIVAGYGASAASVPGPLKAGMLFLIGDLFWEEKETIIGTIVASLPRGVRQMWAPYISRSVTGQ